MPPDIAAALTGAHVIALTKTDGRVRAIATGCSLRETLSWPLFYAATDSNPSATLLKVDSIGACALVLRVTTEPGAQLCVLGRRHVRSLKSRTGTFPGSSAEKPIGWGFLASSRSQKGIRHQSLLRGSQNKVPLLPQSPEADQRIKKVPRFQKKKSASR